MAYSTRRTLASLALASFALALCAVPALAQPDSPAKQVEQRVEEMRTLMLQPDRAKLEAMFAPELTYGHSDGRVQTRAEVVDSLIDGRSKFSMITLSDQKVIPSGDIVVVRHRFVADAVSNGKPGKPDIHVVQVWQNRGGHWLLVLRQAHV